MVRGAKEKQRGEEKRRGGSAKLQTGWRSGHMKRRWVATEAWGFLELRTPFV